MYNVSKNILWKPLLLLEAYCSVYFHRAHILFNCMLECVKCFENLLLRAIASAWSQPPSVLSRSAYIIQLNVWLCIMFWKISSETHCSCLKPTTQCTFTERILCSIVCLNLYNVLKNFFCEVLLLLESNLSVYFHRAHTLFICMFACV